MMESTRRNFIRLTMEPVWMILGESAGVAASVSVKLGIPVQEVEYKPLRQKLLELWQILDPPAIQ